MLISKELIAHFEGADSDSKSRIGMYIPPRYGGGFSKVGGNSPPTPNPSGGRNSPQRFPPVPGGILEFRGGLGGDCQNLKITGLPPGTGGTLVSFGGDLSRSPPQAENFGATMINKPLGNDPKCAVFIVKTYKYEAKM